TLFRTQFKDLMVGMSITNFGSKMQMLGKDTQIPVDVAPESEGNNSKIVGNMKTDKWSLPLNFRFGISFNPIKNYNHRWTVAADALHPSDNTEYVNVGTEYSFKEFIALRAGYKGLFMKDNEEGMTLGAGVMVPMGSTKLAIDYAYADFGILSFVQRFTLSIRF
ncbi:hypothetical protein KAH55_07725, partial [bacterium]|nr:hypothetical protein [bacterium]